MTTLIAFALAALVTYLLRCSMTLVGDRMSEAPMVTSAIGLVSPAVLTAIVTSALLVDEGRMAPPGSIEAAAVGCAFIAVRRTGNVSAALAVGLPLYWLGSFAGLA